jgi:hypothetical protein
MAVDRKREGKGRSSILTSRLRPHTAAVTLYNSLDNGKTHAGARDLLAMQSFEDTKNAF